MTNQIIRFNYKNMTDIIGQTAKHSICNDANSCYIGFMQ